MNYYLVSVYVICIMLLKNYDTLYIEKKIRYILAFIIVYNKTSIIDKRHLLAIYV